MRHFYTAPSATVDATPPAATFHALQAPGLPQWSLVIVEVWTSPDAQDDWENLPNVNEHYIENWGNAAPAVAINAFAPWGAVSGMTIRQIFNLIRQHWSICRL